MMGTELRASATRGIDSREFLPYPSTPHRFFRLSFFSYFNYCKVEIIVHASIEEEAVWSLDMASHASEILVSL